MRGISFCGIDAAWADASCPSLDTLLIDQVGGLTTARSRTLTGLFTEIDNETGR
jgi:hypothetical protein